MAGSEQVRETVALLVLQEAFADAVEVEGVDQEEEAKGEPRPQRPLSKQKLASLWQWPPSRLTFQEWRHGN